MADAYENWNKGADESDDEEQVDEYYNTTGSYLFLIESTPSMLSSDSHSSSQPPSTLPSTLTLKGPAARSKMEICLRSVYAMMRRRVVSSPKDCVGVVIFNKAKKNGGGNQWKNTYVLRTLEQVKARGIIEMKEILEKAQQNPNYLAELLAPNESGSNNLADALGHCSSLFRSKAPKASAKRIYLITDNDNPIGSSEQLLTVVRNKRRDLHDMSFSLEPFFIPPSPDTSFDLDLFYGDLITLPSIDSDSEDIPYPIVYSDLSSTLDAMIDSIRTKEAQKRSAFVVPLVLGEGFVVGVNGFNLVGEEKKKLPVKVDLETTSGEEVVSKTVYKDERSGETLDPKRDIKKYFQVGKADYSAGIEGTKVFFDESEVRRVKTLGRSPAIKLIGFKPKEEYLKFEETVRHSYFIYPNEETFAGSTRTFASLLKSMLKKEVVGIASFLPRVSARPQMVVMVPQEEELTEYGLQVRPPGIHLCQLPFADDMRSIGDVVTKTVIVPPPDDLEEDEDVPLNPKVEAAKKIISKYTNPKGYLPDNFPNPALNFWNDSLAAVALDEEDFPEPDDKTIPAYNTIDARAGKYITALKALIIEDEVDTSSVQTSKKKRTVTDSDAPLADLSEFAEQYFEFGPKMKNDDLKKGLRLMGQSTSGTKAVMMERIDKVLSERGYREGNLKEEEEEEEPKTKKKKSKKTVEDREDDE